MSKQKYFNRIFLAAIGIALLLSVVFIFNTYRDTLFSLRYQGYVIISYPIFMFSSALLILFSCGQLHMRYKETDIKNHSWSFGMVCVIFTVFFLPHIIKGIFNLDGLDFDDIWQDIAASWAAFMISSAVGLFVQWILRKTSK